MNLKFTPIAREDLKNIWEFIAQENLQTAVQVSQIIMQKCRLLVKNPFVGRQREELSPNLRSFSVKNYIIFYRVLSDNIEIIRIINAAQIRYSSIF